MISIILIICSFIVAQNSKHENSILPYSGLNFRLQVQQGMLIFKCSQTALYNLNIAHRSFCNPRWQHSWSKHLFKNDTASGKSSWWFISQRSHASWAEEWTTFGYRSAHTEFQISLKLTNFSNSICLGSNEFDYFRADVVYFTSKSLKLIRTMK